MLVIVLATLPGARAQDNKPDALELNKEKMKGLLDKAEEEYRSFVQRPEKGYEFWAAIKFEMSLGKFDLAALHLKLLLEKEPKEEVNKDLVKIENAEGMSTFLRLREVKRWSDYAPFQQEAEKNVEELIARVTKAVHDYLSAPDRINKFIKNLDAPTPEERIFAFAQLERSREYAVPYMIEALRVNVGKSLHSKIRDALVRMDSAAVPVFLEVLRANDPKDATDADLRLTLLDVVRLRDDKRAIPYLWHLSAAKEYPEIVRQRAKQTLASLLQTDARLLPSSRLSLINLAERYYKHQVAFPPGPEVRIWPWDGQKLAIEPVKLTPHQAEEFFGLRAAREALDLDPAYLPAQKVFLSLLLERTFENELDQFLLKPMPASVQNLLARIDVELVSQVLERALEENRIAVILPAVAALGERGDVKAAGFNAGGEPRGLVRALYYPDRRVQFAAARALVKLPATPLPATALRVVDVLRRFVAGEEKPRALAAYVPGDAAGALRQALQDAGYDLVLAKDLREAFEKLRTSANYDFILLHQGLSADEMPFALTQLRRDADLGRLPVYLVVSKDRGDALRRMVSRYPNVHLLPDVVLTMGEELKKTLGEGIKEAQGPPLSPEERKEMAKVGLDMLWRMARGEVAGYDVRPAQDALWAAVRAPDLVVQALEVLGRVPGSDTQRRLAGLVLDQRQGKLRLPAAMELNRHVQKFGVLLDRRQIDELKAAYQNAGEDAALKGQLALVLGSLRPNPQLTGIQLHEFRPEPPAPPEKKDEK